MIELISTLLPYKILAAQILFVVLVLALIFRKTWGKEVVQFLGKYALVLGLLVSLSAILGSLFYSEIIGFEACVLCWWQRVLLYPMLIIFAIALWKRDRNAFDYIIPLAILAGIIGLYQSYANLGGVSLLSCTAAEGACSKIYVKEFGYITIPMMSLTISLYLLLLAWINKIYRNENSNS
ncbi:MAG: disulfide bond formation protein B [bacterium]|nr:disulfide bond formation protein B [bacterium]